MLTKKKLIILEMYLKLIEKGETLDFDAKDESGKTVLHLACWKKDPIMLELLLEYARDQLRFDILDENGLTPLHYAICNWSSFELIQNAPLPNGRTCRS